MRQGAQAASLQESTSLRAMLCIHCENQTGSEERCESCGESPLVTERRNEEGRFRVKYQFEVDGERREGEHVVPSNWYFAAAEGDEVDVFFSASEPEKSAFRPHPVRPGSAPVQ